MEVSLVETFYIREIRKDRGKKGRERLFQIFRFVGKGFLNRSIFPTEPQRDEKVKEGWARRDRVFGKRGTGG